MSTVPVPARGLRVLQVALTISVLVLLALPSTAQTLTFFNYPAAQYSSPWSINNNGQIVGFYVTHGGGLNLGFLYDVNTATFNSFRVPGNTQVTLGFGINDIGTIVGTSELTTSTGSRGFRRATTGGYHEIVYPGESGSQIAYGINNLDEIVGTYVAPGQNNQNGYLLQAGTFTSLSYPGSTFMQPGKINDAGTIVGTWADSSLGQHGFMLQGGVYTEVTIPGATLVRVNGINNQGDMVGGYELSVGGVEHGFLLVQGVLETVDCAGTGAYTELTAVNDADMFVGGCSVGLSEKGFYGTP